MEGRGWDGAGGGGVILIDASFFFTFEVQIYFFSSLGIYIFWLESVGIQFFMNNFLRKNCFLLLPHSLNYFSNGPSFIFLVPKCPMYDAPENGALVCLNRDADGSASFCQVACEDGTDFNFDPPLLYICAGPGFWMTEILRRVNQLPWPNCSSTWCVV